MTIGKWSVQQGGIVNNVNTLNRLFIPKSSISQLQHHEEPVYTWLLEVAKIKQMSEPTIETFNKVFLYSFGKYDLQFDEQIYNSSLKKQQEIRSLKRIARLKEQR